MHKHVLALGSLAITLACLVSGCGIEVIVEGGSNEELPSPHPNPNTPPAPVDCTRTELHVVGVYDPYDSASDKQGPARVHIDRPGSVKLFLSSYSATDWTVTVGPSTELVAVVAHAYEPVTVNAPAGVAVETFDFVSNNGFLGCGYEYPDTDPHSGCETPQLLEAVAQYMGQQPVSFHGCYAASDFVIDANLDSSSNCATQMGYAHTSMVAACMPPAP